MSKKIGIDMRMAGEGYGIGKYIGELVSAMVKQNYGGNRFVLYFDKKNNKSYGDKFIAPGAIKRFVKPAYYSLREQLLLPIELMHDNLDLVHFPNFNVPVMYPRKFVVTIHDLIHHKYPGTKRKNAIYRWGYRTAIKKAARSAKKIIAVSDSVKAEISKTLNVDQNRIQTVYEGVSGSFFSDPKADDYEKLAMLGIKKPYILWVGVWRGYKNLPVLVQAYSKIRAVFGGSLVLAGSHDDHHPEIYNQIIKTSGLIAPGRVGEESLRVLYRNAECYVHPSLDEGFGLTLIEAQASGALVVASNIPVAREVLGESALYFDPVSVDGLASLLKNVLQDDKLKIDYKVRGVKNARKYTWEQTAKTTLRIYHDALN